MFKAFVDLPVYSIVLICVAAGIVFLWLFSTLLAIIFANIFGHKIKSGNKAINLLLKQRYETSKSMLEMLKKAGQKVDKNWIEIIKKFDHVSDFQKNEKSKRDSMVLDFVHISHSLFILLNDNKEKFDSEEYRILRENYNELEDVYRQKSAVYNADVIGYNYWVRVWYARFLFLMFKKRPKDLIV